MAKGKPEGLRDWTCTRCGGDFSSGKWTCDDGSRHTVELKTYYVKTEGLDVHYGPVSGEGVMNHVRKVISFARGSFQTADPEQQEFLDQYPGCVSYEVWVETHLTSKEREEQNKRKNERLEKQNNELLAQVQELQKQVAAKNAPAPQKANGQPS